VTSAHTEDLRLAVYRCFAGTGRAPAATDLAHELGLTAVEVHRGLRELHAARHLVLDDHDQIVMAHPFSAAPLGFSVMGRETLWWGGCAWDSFALPFLLQAEGDVLVATEPGYTMDLSTLWRFASRWYEGRLDRGYARRDPVTAADYLRSSGLSGPFWGL
jgi:hypothetical protein